MTTSTAKIFHDMAMNLSHEAKMSKTKGDDTAYVEQMTKAFFLEKEAALKVYEDTTVWKHALIRSAGWLAFKSGLFSDALDLVQFGKKGNPPQYLKHELSELEQAITQKLGETSSKSTTQNLSQIFGFLISANIPKSQIEIQKDEHSSITIQVPADKINDIVRIYWGQAVEIQGIEQQNGIFKMSAIKRAA